MHNKLDTFNNLSKDRDAHSRNILRDLFDQGERGFSDAVRDEAKLGRALDSMALELAE